MSVIHINQIKKKIKDMFKKKLDLTDGSSKDENKILTRCLAAFAIYNSFECTVEEAANSVVDGSDDNGIDAIHYSPLNKKLIIVQSKWSNTGAGEPDSAGILKFCKGIEDLVNSRFDRFNKKINEKRKMIEEALNGFETKYELIFIDTHVKKELGRHSTRVIEDLLQKMNDTGDESQPEILTFKRLNQNKTFQSLAKNIGDAPIDAQLSLSQWGKVNEPYNAFYGMISGEEIATWWKEHQTKLFEKNIRQVLGTTEVNREIEITLKENPDLFWYYNNGITIICDSIEKSRIGGLNNELGTFNLKNMAIINGAQTVSTIGRYALKNNDKIENIKVNLRIIALKDTPEDFGKDVTKANNRQNKIENKDFVSQDEEQLRIKTELSLEGVEYSIMRSDSFKKAEKSFDLTEGIIALVCAKNRTDLTVQAKKGIGKFYENLEKGIYKEIFNKSTMGIYIYNCVRINREIEKTLENEINNFSKKSGRKYGLLVHGNRIISQITFHKLNLNDELKNVEFKINKTNIQKKVKNVIKLVNTELEKNYSDNIIGTLFKNTTKCTNIVDEILK